MYFNQLFSNFESVIIDYMKNNNIISVDEEIEDIPESHYQQTLHCQKAFSDQPDFRLTGFHVTTDPFRFIQYFFKLNDTIIDEFKYFFSLVDNIFQKKNTRRRIYLSNNNFSITQNINIEYDENLKTPYFFIRFVFSKSNMILTINNKNELIFRDMAGFFENTYIKIDENDISQSFLTVIELFKQQMFKIIGPTNVVFDHDYVQQFKNISLDYMIQSRLKGNYLYKDFNYRSQYSLLEELKLLKNKYPNSGISLSTNGMIFSGCDIPLFLYFMKSMFSKSVYSNIEKSMNFYHIFNVLMNNHYFIEVVIHIKNKLDNIDNIMTISFDDIVFDVALKNDLFCIDITNETERKTLFEIYTKKK